MTVQTAFSKCAKTFNAKAKSLAEKTEDAYSYGRYGEKSWLANIKYLLGHYTEVQVEWIMRSKNARWAADASESRSNTVPMNTMKKWHKSGELDFDSEIPKSEHIPLPNSDKIREVKAAIELLEELLVQLEQANKA